MLLFIVVCFCSQSGFTSPLQGYLTLQQNGPGQALMLKWIPNALLQDSSSAQRYAHNHRLYPSTCPNGKEKLEYPPMSEM